MTTNKDTVVRQLADAKLIQKTETITLTKGSRHIALDEIDKALAATGKVFQRSRCVVYVSSSKMKKHGLDIPEGILHLGEATPGWIADRVGRIAKVVRIGKDGKAKTLTDVPTSLASLYIDRREWSLPNLRGVSKVPLLDKAGNIVTAHGYNAPSETWIDWEHGPLNIPDNPSKDDALAALAKLSGLLVEFPFASEADKAIALCGLMAGVLRPSMARCVAIAFTSPVPSSGKSTLVATIGSLATNTRPLPVTYGHDDSEFQKRVASTVLSGSPVVVFDNLNASALNSDALASAISEAAARIRRFNTLAEIEVPCPSLFLLNGNNLSLADDMLRRVLECSLDPKTEHPENRTFKSDPEATALKERPDLVAAVFTIERAYRQARPELKRIPLNGFEEFTALIRDPLLWLTGQDAVAKMQATKAANPKRNTEADLLRCWYEAFGGEKKKARDVVATHHQGLKETMEEMTPNGKPTSQTFSRVCSRLKGRIINGLVLQSDGDNQYGLYYRVLKLENA